MHYILLYYICYIHAIIVKNNNMIDGKYKKHSIWYLYKIINYKYWDYHNMCG